MSSEFIDINLLPKPIQASGIVITPGSRRPIALGVILLLGALIVLAGTTFIQQRNARLVEAQTARREAMSKIVLEMGQVTTEVEALQQQVTTLAQQAQILEGEAERVSQSNPSLAPFLRSLVESLLPRMKITAIVSSGNNRFTVQGEAGSNSLVIEYANSLKQRPEIRSVTPRSVEQLGGDAPPGSVKWILDVER